MDLSTGASVLTAALTCALAVSVALLVVSRVQLRRARRRLRTLENASEPLTNQAARAAGWAVRGVVGTAVRIREQGVGGMLRSSIEELTGFALEDKQAIDRVIGEDGTVTIVFSDIEDSTALNERLGDDAWVALLDAHDQVIRKLVAKAGGHVVKSQGDGFMLAFGDPAAAVNVAIAMQRALTVSRRRALRRTPIRVRIGVHAGHVVHREGDYFGLNVAMAARVAGLAVGGEILASEGVRDAVPDQHFRLRMPAASLKGIPGHHQLWSVEWTPVHAH
ncbi:adenylate/guanylate cyclase domain-containing protein [Nocardioides jiangxiensis]|uniref:Adenylate/guanylate cyclase domain-containing protein n=1 Tax=Nocardioides jiangxiensis TaxID=3064524 RepID=A0ABT9AY22_9ACTN|nr:adenylate/guanylate cyclase domain-containing protein [Nocardioides sp. WY-20]MDO7866788.1 adenylate/guanylate cyclase domain-containing protein [Nocardioides sp. WY-20]